MQDGKRQPVEVPWAVLAGIEGVQYSGVVDMLDRTAVQHYATENAAYDTAAWIENNPGLYVEGVLAGFAAERWKEVGYSADEFMRFYKDTLDYIIELDRSGTRMHENMATIILRKILCLKASTYTCFGSPCGAALNQVAYTQDGDIYACDESRSFDIFRIGNVAVGPVTAEGARIAVKRTSDGYIYEWAYPKASIAPIQLKAGGRFRLSLFLFDTDATPGEAKPFSPLGGIQFGGFNANVDARPVKWREFVLTE